MYIRPKIEERYTVAEGRVRPGVRLPSKVLEPLDFWKQMIDKYSSESIQMRDGLRVEHVIFSCTCEKVDHWRFNFNYGFEHPGREVLIHWTKVERVLQRLQATGWEIRDSVALYCQRGRIIRYDR